MSVWQLGDTIPQYKQLEFDVFSKKLEPLGCHTFPYGDNGRAYLNKWIDRPRTNRKPAIPMKNAIAVADKNFSLTTGCDESIAIWFYRVMMFRMPINTHLSFRLSPQQLWCLSHKR